MLCVMLLLLLLQEAMCVRHKGDPKLLQKLPLFSPDQVLTNGIDSPHHMILNGDSELSEPTIQVTAAELEEALPMTLEGDVLLSTLDSKHLCLDLVKDYQIELERIDQQLLELGPYAQDAYDEEPSMVSVPLLISPPPDVRRGKKGKQAAAQKTNRRLSRGVDDLPEHQRGGWRAVSSGWNEVSDRRSEEKEPPKKKWRKVGSAGPIVRGKEGQLDAHSDPLNVSSANIIITPASDLDIPAIYQPPGGKQNVDRDLSDGMSYSSLSNHTVQDQKERQVSTIHSERPGSTTAHSTPSCNTSSPSDLPGHTRPQPTAHWKPVSGGPTTHGNHSDYPHPLHEGYTHHNLNHQHPPQTEASEEIDVTRVESEDARHLMGKAAEGRRISGSEPHDKHRPPPSQGRRGSHGSKSGHQPEVISDLHHTQTPSPKTITTNNGVETHMQMHVAPQYNVHPTNGTQKQPGFSISQLAKGSDTPPPQMTTHDSHHIDHRGSLTGSVPSPHGELDGNIRKRRTSSSSSHRSTRQHSIDDNSHARSGSPLSASHVRSQYMPGVIWGEGGPSIHSPSNKDKPVESKVPTGMGPFAMWPPGVPVPSDPAQVQRLALSSQFLAASNPWLRGGMIPGLPLRPALYPTPGPAAAAANSLDPSTLYKSMLAGVPLYPFSAAGLKGPFPAPAFSAPNSAANSQPQTPSSISAATAGFAFIPHGLSTAALREAQSRLPGGTAAQLVQHPSFAVANDNKQRGSPETNQDATQPWHMIPGMQMLQSPFGFQGQLSASVSQASQLNLLGQRGSVPFSTSPLTLVTQSFSAGGSTGDIPQSVLEAYHHQAGGGGGRRGKKQSGSAIDLTGREQVVKHIEAPSPQEAVKMATQRISPFHDPSRFSPKLQSVPEGPSSSSTLLSGPTFVTNPNALPTQGQGPVLSYPVFSGPSGVGNSTIGMSGHLINPSQMMGMALPGSHMISMNYPAMQNMAGKGEEVTAKKRRSPKRGNGAQQKLRIHQMDFKQQGKVDRRRKRPLKPQEKQPDESVLVTPSTKPVVDVHRSGTSSPGSEQQPSATPTTSEDNYALNMLADCSSKEGEKTSPPQTITSPVATKQTQELAAKRALMRSPGSIAGANSLLLLAKPDPVSSSGTTGTPPENAVVDSLLKLSNTPASSSLASSSSQGAQNDGISGSESGTTQSLAAEAILMMGHGSGQGGEDENTHTKNGRNIPSPITTIGDEGHVIEGKEREDVDSEKTDTDSEATLSPTTPAPTSKTHKPSTTMKSPPFMTTSSFDASVDHHPTVTKATNETLTLTTQSVNVTKMAPVEQEHTISVGVDTTDTIIMPPVTQPNVNKRKLLDLGPSSTRLQMVEDEEDADVDVENLDSSLLDEPVQPVFNTSQSSSQSEPILNSTQVETSETVAVDPGSPSRSTTTVAVAPEIVPTSPQSQEDETSLITSSQTQLQTSDSPSSEQTGDMALNTAADKVHEEAFCAPPVTTDTGEGDALADPIIDSPSPSKKIKLEEKQTTVVEEENERIQSSSSVDQNLNDVDLDRPNSPLPQSPTSSQQTMSFTASPPCLPDVAASSNITTRSLTPSPVTDSKPIDDRMETELSTPLENVENSQSHAIETDLTASSDKECDSHTAAMETNVSEEVAASCKEETPTEAGPSAAITAPVPLSETEEDKTSQESSYEDDGSDNNPSASILWPNELDSSELPSEDTKPIEEECSPKSSPIPLESDTTPPMENSNRQYPASPVNSSVHEALHVTDSCEITPSTTGVETEGSPSSIHQEREENQADSPEHKTQVDNIGAAEKPTKDLPGQSDVVRRISPPPVIQNRLPVGKFGFDRHQQNRKLLSAQHVHKPHSRDEKSGQSKKWSRMADQGVRGRGLFDVDPLEGNRRLKTDNKPSERDPMKHILSDGRKVKPRISPPVHGHSNKPTPERPKYSNTRPPRVSSHEDVPARHNRPQDGHQGSGGSWDQREVVANKQKMRPSLGRLAARHSPSSDHSTIDHLKDRDEPPALSDEDQSRSGGVGGRGRGSGGHQNSHGWREDRHSPTDHIRERGHVLKHKGHRTESKQGFDHGRKIVRLDKDPQLQQRKHVSMTETNCDERGAVVFKRHRGGDRDDESDHTHMARLKHVSSSRKRSYESVSEDDLPEDTNRSSSRESSLVSDDRTRGERRFSSQEAVSEQQRWRKEPKRTPLDGLDDAVDDFSRSGNKHKKHKHDGKECKERRKWRKVVEGSGGGGGDPKQKRSSEDKMWLGYHKH